MPKITTFDILDDEIKKVRGKPTVLEALWDGDTQGWYLLLFIYKVSGHLFLKKESRHFLGVVSVTDEMEDYVNDKWTVAEFASYLGKKAKEKYNLVFYFPSEKDPDSDCPKWTERHLAIHCADCNKLIIPTDSPYLPKDICYNCHLKRERNEKLREEVPYDEGVTMCLAKDGNYQKISYCTYFKGFTIAPFISKKVQIPLMEPAVNAITLNKQDIILLKSQLENAVDALLTVYKRPELDEKMKRFIHISRVHYKGKEYELMHTLNRNHIEIAQMISSIETGIKAISEDFSYVFFIKKGFIYRDEVILRFIGYVCNGATSRELLVNRYAAVLSEKDISDTLSKLEQMKCIVLHKDKITITQVGISII